MPQAVIPDDHPRRADLAALRLALETAWCAETSFWPGEWTPDRSSFGQCAVTALVVHDRFGGVIQRTINDGVPHYWNRVDGIEVDLTRDQFTIWAPELEVAVVDPAELLVSGPTLAARHRRLSAALRGTRTAHLGPELTDGVVRLAVLRTDDLDEHLAGEDEELWRWLSGAPGTPASVGQHIDRSRRSWATGGPRRNLGVWDVGSGALIGNVEANFADDALDAGEVNITYAVWPAWRGRGIAARAVELLVGWIAVQSPGHTAVIKADPANSASQRVAACAGFDEDGTVAVDRVIHRRFVRTPLVGEGDTECFARFDRQDSGCIGEGVRVGGSRFFVKHAGQVPAVASLRRAVLFHEAVQHPAIVGPIDATDDGDDVRLVYPWVDGEVLCAATVDGTDRAALVRFQQLDLRHVRDAIAAILDAHRVMAARGFVAVDLYDGCFLYDFDRHRMRLIDLDEYRPGPFVVEGDRMPGSTRYMAPEEHVRGAVIDERTTVFNLGRTVQHLLTDPAGEWRGTVGERALVDAACALEPERRPPSVPALVGAWGRG